MKKLYWGIAILLFLSIIITSKVMAIDSDEVTLNSLRINIAGITPDFKKDINNYYITVGNEVNDIEVEAIAENPDATIEITGNYNLQEGLNLITINIISSDRMQNNTYTIQVTKTDEGELANTNLEILAIENILLNPPFDANITHYDIEVPNQISSLNILAVPENINASVEIIGNDEIEVGNNLISVFVTAQNDFSKKEYVINAYRRNEQEEAEFEDEQEINEMKLEQIYKIERLSSSLSKNDSNKQNLNNKQVVVAILLVAIILILCITLIIKKYNNK